MTVVSRSRLLGVAQAWLGTTSDIAVEIDPASTVPTPPDGTIFLNQTEVDAYLDFHGGDSFKYVQDFIDTLPGLISHAITVTLVPGIHRPSPAKDYIVELRRESVAGGFIAIEGSPVATWDTVHAGGTIRSHVVGSDDPWVDCDPGTFPDDNSLAGRFAVFSNGFYGLVWKHTDQRLWIARTLNPAPIDDSTTVSVKQPSTILRNSIDDSTRANSYVFLASLNQSAETWTTSGMSLSDVMVQDFSAPIVMNLWAGTYDVDRVVIDKVFGPIAENGNCWALWSGRSALRDCSCIATPGSGADEGFTIAHSRTGSAYLYCCYSQGFRNGNYGAQDGAAMWIYSSVSRHGGGAWDAVWSWLGSQLIFGKGLGVIPTIADVNAGGGLAALSFGGPVVNDMYWAGALRIMDVVGDAVNIYDNVLLDLSYGTSAFVDGGGITGSGFNMKGSGSTLVLGSGTDLTGTLGDVKFEDGDSVWSYDQIQEIGPIADGRMNLVRKVS